MHPSRNFFNPLSPRPAPTDDAAAQDKLTQTAADININNTAAPSLNTRYWDIGDDINVPSWSPSSSTTIDPRIIAPQRDLNAPLFGRAPASPLQAPQPAHGSGLSPVLNDSHFPNSLNTVRSTSDSPSLLGLSSYLDSADLFTPPSFAPHETPFTAPAQDLPRGVKQRTRRLGPSVPHDTLPATGLAPPSRRLATPSSSSSSSLLPITSHFSPHPYRAPNTSIPLSTASPAPSSQFVIRGLQPPSQYPSRGLVPPTTDAVAPEPPSEYLIMGPHLPALNLPGSETVLSTSSTTNAVEASATPTTTTTTTTTTSSSSLASSSSSHKPDEKLILYIIDTDALAYLLDVPHLLPVSYVYDPSLSAFIFIYNTRLYSGSMTFTVPISDARIGIFLSIHGHEKKKKKVSSSYHSTTTASSVSSSSLSSLNGGDSEPLSPHSLVSLGLGPLPQDDAFNFEFTIDPLQQQHPSSSSSSSPRRLNPSTPSTTATTTLSRPRPPRTMTTVPPNPAIILDIDNHPTPLNNDNNINDSMPVFFPIRRRRDHDRGPLALMNDTHLNFVYPAAPPPIPPTLLSCPLCSPLPCLCNYEDNDDDKCED